MWKCTKKKLIFKYIVILINSKLSLSDHIHVAGICNKARKILAFYRWFYKDSSCDTLRALYISMVGPHLEHNTAQLWDPSTHCDVNKLAAVQRSAVTMKSHQCDATYEDLLSINCTEKLEERRLKLKLTQVYKIAHGLHCFPENIFVLHESHSL